MRSRLTGLWKHPDFMKLWMGQTISEFGSRITRGGLPLIAVLILNATPAQMGFLQAIASLPVLLLGLFAGVLVDRARRRPLMIVCDVLRMGILLLIPLSAIGGFLSFGLVCVVAAAMALLSMVFEVAYRAYLPTLIEREHVLEGNSKLSTTDALAEIGGPALTGLLVQIMTAPAALLVDALSFLASLISLSRIRTPEPKVVDAAHRGNSARAVLIELWEGIRHTLSNPLLRTLAMGMGARAFFGSFLGTFYDLYVVRELGMTPVTLGLLVGCGGIGALIGSVVAGWLPRKIGMMPSIMGALIVSGLINLCIPLAGTLVSVDPRVAVLLLGASQIIGDGAMMVYWINEISLRQMIVPTHLLGRVNASFGFLGEGVAPFGALVAGALGSTLGVQPALWISVTGILCTALIIAASPVRRFHAIPSIIVGESAGS